MHDQDTDPPGSLRHPHKPPGALLGLGGALAVGWRYHQPLLHRSSLVWGSYDALTPICLSKDLCKKAKKAAADKAASKAAAGKAAADKASSSRIKLAANNVKAAAGKAAADKASSSRDKLAATKAAAGDKATSDEAAACVAVCGCSLQPSMMGTFRRTMGTPPQKNGNRYIYLGDKGQVLYYWAEPPRWILGVAAQGCATGGGFLYADGDVSCPSHRSAGLGRARLVHPWAHEPEVGVGRSTTLRVARCQTWTILDSVSHLGCLITMSRDKRYNNFSNRPYPIAQIRGTI